MEVLGNVLDTQVLLNVFFLPSRTGVGLLRPDQQCRLCGRVPVGVGGLGILCTQFVNVGMSTLEKQLLEDIGALRAPSSEADSEDPEECLEELFGDDCSVLDLAWLGRRSVRPDPRRPGR